MLTMGHMLFGKDLYLFCVVDPSNPTVVSIDVHLQ